MGGPRVPPREFYAVPVDCPRCGRAPYRSRSGLYIHLTVTHPDLGSRDRSVLLEQVRREAERSAS